MEDKISTNVIVVRHFCNQEESLNNRKSFLKKLKLERWEYFDDYCENTSIHGLRYFTMKKMHLLERIWWFMSVFCSFVTCCILISKSYDKWNENPVIVAFSEKMVPIKDIPFPAVTICPEPKSNRNLFDFTEILRRLKNNSVLSPFDGLSEKEITFVTEMIHICVYAKWNYIPEGYNFTDDNIFDVIREVAPKLNDSLVDCEFQDIGSCKVLFEEVITDDGLCFTFNSLNSQAMFTDGFDNKVMTVKNETNSVNHWSLENGYDKNFEDAEKVHPYRVSRVGWHSGIEVTMRLRTENKDYFCRGPLQGFKIMVHPPNELPRVNSQFFRVTGGQEIRVSIKPNLLQTKKSLENFSPSRRRCYFNSERKLRYFKTYSQQNCDMECLANLTYSECGCVKFSMPRDNSTPICSINRILCYKLAESGLYKDGKLIKIRDNIDNCNCLPACTSISYDAEISYVTTEYEKFYNEVGYSEQNTNGYEFADLSIQFKENQFIAVKRSDLVGLTDFIASCGGLLGLFMGVSLLSIIEVIYYFSLRLFCNIRSRKNKQKPIIPSIQKSEREQMESTQWVRSNPLGSPILWNIGE